MRILLIDDDRKAARVLARGLQEEGFVVDVAHSAEEGDEEAFVNDYGVILLDRMLPGMDGMAVLGALRAAKIETPVIILSALGTPDDRVGGLTSGADDYLVKPFAFAELLARVRLLLRKRGAAEGAVTKLNSGDLEMDLLSRRVKRGARVIDLQPREFRLLEYFLRHPDQVITRTMLLEGVWDYHFDPGTNVIDVHISRLRKKLDDGGEPILHTIRGAGYRLGPAA